MSNVNDSGGRRSPKNVSLDRGGLIAKPGPFVGEVMQTVDTTRSGRIWVWLDTFGDEGSKKEPSSWFLMRYLSPFYGVTPHEKIDAPDTDFETTGHAYGMWMNAPDVGTKVLCMFAEGNPDKGFYIGYVPEPQMTHMLPAIGAQENPHYNNAAQESKLSRAKRLPVTEIDKQEASMNDAQFNKIPKPVHSCLAGQMWAAGTVTDNIRGPIGSSAQRESPSRVYGISTPGREVYVQGMFDHNIKEKLAKGEVTDTGITGRRGGHSIVMDDGDLEGHDNLMRFRTSTGHQILLSDDGGAIYIAHANGQSWIELGNEGTVDVFAANSINLRTGGDFNVHADNDINLNAKNRINMFAKKDIIAEADGNLLLTGKKKFEAYSKQTLGLRSDGTLAMDSLRQASWWSRTSTVEIKAANIGLNHGFPAMAVAPIKALTQNNFADAVQDDTHGWVSEPNKYKSIASRSPSHEPYIDHNVGVPVKVTYKPSTASAPEPVPAPAKTEEVNEEVAATPVPVNIEVKDVLKEATSGADVVPMKSLDEAQVTGIMTGLTKTVDQASDVVSDKGIGAYGISIESLQAQGVIKQGVNVSGDIETVLADSSIFTGKQGVSSIKDLLGNEALQSKMVQATSSATLGKLSQTGVLSGAETPEQLAGIAGLAGQFNPSEIKAWVDGAATPEMAAQMNDLAKTSQYAVDVVSTKTAGLIDKVKSGSGITKTSAAAVNTIDTSKIDAATNEIIGLSRIPNLGPALTSIKQADLGITAPNLKSLNNGSSAESLDANLASLDTSLKASDFGQPNATLDKAGTGIDGSLAGLYEPGYVPPIVPDNDEEDYY